MKQAVSAKADSFNPFGEEYLLDPPGSLRWSREDEPVFYSPMLDYWVVTRYQDVKEVFRDNVRFSPSIALEKITPVCAEAVKVLEKYDYGMNRTLVNEDEPAHMPRRRVLLDPFTPSQLAAHEPKVRKLVRRYVNRFVDSGEVDLVNSLLWEVPLTVAMQFLGIPEDDMDTLRKYSIAHTVNTWGRPSREEQVSVAEAVGQFWQYAGKVLEKLKRDPSGPGWMPFSIRAQKNYPEVITDSYLHSIMMAGIVAAHETTANAAANSIKLLLENRESWQEICDQPELIPNAVEESLRHSGSVAAWRRLVTQSTTIGGVSVPEGARLLIVNSSANHDERQFPEPDEFNIRRENAAEHLTFGYGSHQCLGKNLARMELQVILQELTARLPHMHLVIGQKFTYLANTSFRGPDHLWVRWDPVDNPERRDGSILERRDTVVIGEPPTRSIRREIEVKSIEKLASEIVSIHFVDAGRKKLPRWTPGAHIDLQFGEFSRQYSLCGDPSDLSSYRIAVLRETDGRGGSSFIHEKVKVGQRFKIRGPRNHFKVDSRADRYLFIAGGIGITPIIAMADQASRQGAVYEVHYCGRSRGAMAFLDRLSADHATHTYLYVSDEGTRLDVEHALNGVESGTQVYACGPDRLLMQIEKRCAELPADTLHLERFSRAAPALDPSVERAFELELLDSNLTIVVPPDETMLTALRSANIDVPSDCEEGLCGTCEVSVVSGEIDHRDVVLTNSERIRNNKMMACCSRAHSDHLKVRL